MFHRALRIYFRPGTSAESQENSVIQFYNRGRGLLSAISMVCGENVRVGGEFTLSPSDNIDDDKAVRIQTDGKVKTF